jgi:hypothetical protein
MSIKTKALIALGIVLVGLVATRLGLFSKQPSDQQLIEQSLTEALTAAKQGRSGPVLDFISNQFQINSEVPFDRREIARFVRQSHPEVTVVNLKAKVSGDTALIVSPVHVKVEFIPKQVFEHEFQDVSIGFRRENSVKWLIFPSKQWRLFQVQSAGVSQVSDWAQ